MSEPSTSKIVTKDKCVSALLSCNPCSQEIERKDIDNIWSNSVGTYSDDTAAKDVVVVYVFQAKIMGYSKENRAIATTVDNNTPDKAFIQDFTEDIPPRGKPQTQISSSDKASIETVGYRFQQNNHLQVQNQSNAVYDQILTKVGSIHFLVQPL